MVTLKTANVTSTGSELNRDSTFAVGLNQARSLPLSDLMKVSVSVRPQNIGKRLTTLLFLDLTLISDRFLFAVAIGTDNTRAHFSFFFANAGTYVPV